MNLRQRLNAMSDKEYAAYTAKLFGKPKKRRLKSLTRSQWWQSKQYKNEKAHYADYVFWKMQVERTMKRLGMFIFR